MKILALLLTLLSQHAFSQDPTEYMKQVDSKIYSLKSKGVKEFIVDVQSTRLTKQVKDQQIFGKVKELIFRTYWTAQPERLAIEVVGLPEGFKEVKQELRMSIMPIIENLLPLPMTSKFNGYKFTSGAAPKQFVATDTTGVAQIPAYELKFDEGDRLVEVTGKKPVGTFQTKYEYDKPSFADGKSVVKSIITTASESGLTVTSEKELEYGKSEGFGVLTELESTVVQKSALAKSKPLELEDEFDFENYKINTGDAAKFFGSDAFKEMQSK